MLSAFKKQMELLKVLMRRFVDDVERGIHPSEAGWIGTKDLPVDELLKSGLAEKGEKGIRLLYNADLQAAIGKISDAEAEELALTCRDTAKGVETCKIITKVSELLPSSPELQAGVVILGWWRMLVTSDFPVVVDEVLNEHFSPDQWYIEAPKASLDLALTVVHKWWDIQDGSALESIKSFASLTSEASKTKSVGRIKSVLKWDGVLDKLSREDSEALAFIWFADYLSATKGVYHPESITFIQRQAWNLLEQSSKKRKPEIIDQVEGIVSSLPSPQLVSWPEIIRFPW